MRGFGVQALQLMIRLLLVYIVVIIVTIATGLICGLTQLIWVLMAGVYRPGQPISDWIGAGIRVFTIWLFASLSIVPIVSAPLLIAFNRIGFRIVIIALTCCQFLYVLAFSRDLMHSMREGDSFSYIQMEGLCIMIAGIFVVKYLILSRPSGAVGPER